MNPEIINTFAVIGVVGIYLFIGWLVYHYINWLLDDVSDDDGVIMRFTIYSFAIITLPFAIVMTIIIIIDKIIKIPNQLEKLDKLDNIEADIKKLSAKRSKK